MKNGNGNGNGSGPKRLPPANKIRVADEGDFVDDDELAQIQHKRTPEFLTKPQERPLTAPQAAQYVTPLESDGWLYRIAVGALAFVVVSGVVVYPLLAFYEKKPPEGLVALVSAAVAALALLVRPQKREGGG